MIPSKLTLKNFTSYGEDTPILDFSQFKMAAISGLNGAGKSSLLDAITWCLWGASRAGDSADPLIHLGSDQMYVEFSFNLDGHQYSVKRSRIKKGGGSSNLELWSNSHNLTEGTIKATQQKIIDTLHLSFETFTNSSFLRQGHADEFTLKGPTDRKRILADILGLDHYDLLEEKAKEKVKEAESKLQLLDYQILEIETELSQKEERKKILTQIEEDGKKAQKNLKEKETQIKTLEEQKNALEKKHQILKEQTEKYLSLEKEVEDLRVQVELKKQAQEEYKDILSQKDRIEKNHQRLQDLEKQRSELEGKRSELIKIKNELAQIQQQLISRENKRTQVITSLEIQIKELQTQNEAAQEQLNHLNKDKGICPTCGQVIKSEQSKELQQNNQTIISGNQAKIKNIEATIKKYQDTKLPEEATIKEKESTTKALENDTKQWTQIDTEIKALKDTDSDFLKLSQAQVGIEAQTEVMLDLQKIIDSKTKELEKSSTQENDLEEVLNSLEDIKRKLEEELSFKEELNEKVLELRSRYGEAKQLVSRSEQLQDLAKEKNREKENLKKANEIYSELALAFGKKGIQAMIIEQAIPEIEDETNKLLDRLTEGRMKIRLDTQRETKTKTAIGEEGKKEKGLVETLDIVISDEMGERSYEMYSGGEAFRVNFAIRLAISKLLTHRAGARLQFLVIDEGFGTQDAAGRAKLVEVLDAIKDDFEKILIITHLEELKEEFPTRIEVSKNSAGSTFEVIGV